MSDQASGTKMGRRAFLAGAAATTFTIVKPSAVRSAEANSALQIGMIGCGGRGSWIARLFEKAGGYKFVACSDYFQDRVDAFGEKNGVDSSRRYTTLSGYKRLIESPVDAVVIESPPYFHPEHAAAAIEAGKHVYLAKPIAVDVPGCQSIAASGKRATEKNRVFLVDFQTRANPMYQECVKRVRAGDIGTISFVEAHYPWAGGGSGTESKNPEDILRNWYCTLAISGDVIVEQDIHALDVATWFIDANPVQAVGSCGRKLRKFGNIKDSFSVTYWFPGDLLLNFSSVKMIPGCQDEIRCRVFGSNGMVGTDYFGSVWIRGNKPYEGGPMNNLYTSGAMDNIYDFRHRVAEKIYDNPTVAPSVRSNMTSVLGREAAYANGKVVTWNEVVKSNKKLTPPLKGLRA